VTEPIRAIITGISGRMGSTLVRVARSESGMVVVGGTERPGHAPAGSESGSIPCSDNLRSALDGAKADVVIDFTSAEASSEHARICAERGVAFVVGSTGFSPAAKAEVTRAALKIPVVMAPNMSVGVNLVIKVAADLAKVLGDGYDIDILETHHRMKKDAPSGTALRLAEEMAHASGRTPQDFRFERHGQIGERPPREIGLQAMRGGDVVGEHTVFFFGDGERIELTHRATSREQFARGAVRAARWVVGRVPGLYDMQDVLGLRAP
jgi:4-hydroxy-tetrahydrodipicolinate reductase